MELFKTTKKQPIKFTNFKYIGNAKNYPNICYYYKELPRDNFELMTCTLEVTKRKIEVGAGTNVKVLDPFMSNYLYNLINNIKPTNIHNFVKTSIETSFADLKEEDKNAMIYKYNSVVPKEIKDSKSYNKFKKDGYNLLYCSNDESEERKFGIVNIMLVKEVEFKSKDERIDINSAYTYFKPLKFMVSPEYIKGTSKIKYREVDVQEIVVDHDILI